MKKLILAMLTLVPFAAMAENFGLTVDSVSANINGSGFDTVSFREGNPIPGPTGCANRYRFDGGNAIISTLVNRSSEGDGERMTFTLRDELPTVRNNCDLVGVETIN